MTPEEYLLLEREAEEKSEYDDGVMYPLPGGTFDHSAIVAGLLSSLRSRVPPSCKVLASSMKVRIPGPTRFFYPDASIVCTTPELAYQEKDVLLNPSIVFEVLSPATEHRDRGRKFHSYQSIESLLEYVLVSAPYLIESYRRERDHLIYTKFEGREARLLLPSIGCEIALADIYYQVAP
jgi:Uma2 family endonuclease